MDKEPKSAIGRMLLDSFKSAAPDIEEMKAIWSDLGKWLKWVADLGQNAAKWVITGASWAVDLAWMAGKWAKNLVTGKKFTEGMDKFNLAERAWKLGEDLGGVKSYIDDSAAEKVAEFAGGIVPLGAAGKVSKIADKLGTAKKQLNSDVAKTVIKDSLNKQYDNVFLDPRLDIEDTVRILKETWVDPKIAKTVIERLTAKFDKQAEKFYRSADDKRWLKTLDDFDDDKWNDASVVAEHYWDQFTDKAMDMRHLISRIDQLPPNKAIEYLDKIASTSKDPNLLKAIAAIKAAWAGTALVEQDGLTWWEDEDEVPMETMKPKRAPNIKKQENYGFR